MKRLCLNSEKIMYIHVRIIIVSDHSNLFDCQRFSPTLRPFTAQLMTKYIVVLVRQCQCQSCAKSPCRKMLSAGSETDGTSQMANSDWADEKLLSPRSMYSNSWCSANSSTIDPVPQLLSLRLIDDAADGRRAHGQPWNTNQPNNRIAQTHSSTSFAGSTKNYTFTDDQLRDIHRSNACLMDRLQKVKRSKSTTAANAPVAPVAVASATINRQKKEREIQRTNSILMAKLEAIARKKSKSLY